MSDDNVINMFTGKGAGKDRTSSDEDVTYGHIPPNNVLTAAVEVDLQEVLVAGWTKDGTLYLASSEGYTPDIVTLCELAKNAFLSSYE